MAWYLLSITTCMIVIQENQRPSSLLINFCRHVYCIVRAASVDQMVLLSRIVGGYCPSCIIHPVRMLLVVFRNPTRVVCRRSGNGHQTILHLFMTPLSSANAIRNKKQVVFILCRHDFSKLRFCRTNKTLL